MSGIQARHLICLVPFLVFTSTLLVWPYQPFKSINIDERPRIDVGGSTADVSRWTIYEAFERERLRHLDAIGYDSDEITSIYNSKHAAIDPDYTIYHDRLETFIHEYFRSFPTQGFLLNAIDFPSAGRSRFRELPKTIWSTCQDGIRGVPDGFQRWFELEKYGWEINVVDDDGMDEKYLGWAAEYGGDSEGLWRRLWDALPVAVLKTDVFRLMSVVAGGIYVDSDVIPRAHPHLWASGSPNTLPPSLQVLHDLLTPPSQINQTDPYANGIANPDIGIVLAIEMDDGPPRLQMVQYAMMAKPFHPIIIDALEEVVRNIETCIRDDKMDGSVGVLEMTGPRPFSNAIMRYLLIRYGVTHNDLRAITKPARFGDVLVLPSYSSIGPMPVNGEWDFEAELDPREYPYKHVYMGRWISDTWGVTGR